ncbi:hypothetical protein FOCC_FOCC012673 [Frankliniella occidentalis]|nr:hypothetical protein FOCC_FOCC012673 [Frankliniella occidentalis]
MSMRCNHARIICCKSIETILLGDPTFKKQFRMDRSTFEVGPHAKMQEFLVSRFGVSISTVHDHYKCIIKALREMVANYIRWSTAYEQEIIAENFENLYGYPGVCGCIDGSHINIAKPLYQG